MESSQQTASASPGPESAAESDHRSRRTALLLSLASCLGSVSRVPAGLAAVVALTVPAFAWANSPTISFLASQLRVGEVVRTRISNREPQDYSYAWYRSVDKTDWTRIKWPNSNKDYYGGEYTPTSQDLGKYLRVVYAYGPFNGPKNEIEAVSAGVVGAQAAAPRLEVTELVTGLSIPWDLAFAPDGTLLFTERGGKLKARLTNGTVQTITADLSDLWVKGNTGLMSIVVDPNFTDNRRFYTCQAHTNPKEIQVIAWTINAAYDTATRTTDPLVGGIPRNDEGGHAGCRLRFGPNGYLWVSTGDAAQSANPQDKDSLGGKVLRVNAATGAGHSDNPFASPSSPLIYSYGHRNPQGLARRPGTNQMWSVEHGPSDDDEINLLSSGGNYGWNPRKAPDDSTYDESVPMTDLTEFPNAIEAKWSSGTKSEATSGGIFLDGDQWGPWQGRLAVATLAQQALFIVEFTSDGDFVSEIQVFDNTYGRLRTPVIGPDKALYLTTSNSGYTSTNPNADKILKVTPSLPAKWVSVSTRALTVAEDAATNTYTVVLTSQPTADVTVTPTSSDTSKATVSDPLTFATTDWDTPQTVTVTGVNDSISNTSGRTATITHTTASTDSGYNNLSSTPSIGVTVSDDDAVTITPTALTVAENAGTATYTVTLNVQPSADVTITVTSDTPAHARVHTGSGSPSPTTSLTFTTTDWNTAQTVTVTGVDDTIANSDRTATITHAVSGGYTDVAAPSVTVTLTNDDRNSGNGGNGGGGRGGDSLDFDRHGNTAETASLLRLGRRMTGTIQGRTDVDYFFVNVAANGVLSVRTTGTTNTTGQLEQDGQVLASDDNSGAGNNFQLDAPVTPGTYDIAVRGITTGDYTLAVRLVQGRLETPPVGITSVQSGLSVLRGWVCEADLVEIELERTDGTTYLLETAAGTARGDVAATCGGMVDSGFGLLWNWNILGEGAYTVRALADDIVFGEATVTVTMPEPSEEYLKGKSGQTLVTDFPAAGQQVRLVWSQGLQNFSLTTPEAVLPPRPPVVSVPWGHLDNPAGASFQSGLGVISGWVCEAEAVTLEVTTEAGVTHTLDTSYGTVREAQAAARCEGKEEIGFGLLFNWNLFGAGVHTLRALADGEEFGRAAVRVTTLGSEYLTGVSGQARVVDFPEMGQTTRLEWQEAAQNFVIMGVE